MYTLADDIKRYQPVLTFTRFVNRRTLSFLRFVFFTIALLSGLASASLAIILPVSDNTILLGVCLIATALWLEQILIYSYYNSYYFYGLNSILGLSEEKITGTTYEVAEVLSQNEEDVTKAFCLSRLGTEILLRTEVTDEALDKFLSGERVKITTAMIPLPEGQIFSLLNLGRYLLQQDTAFKKMFASLGIGEGTFLGALNWVVLAHHQEKKKLRWWGKDNLSRTKGIGREWAYGTPFHLEKFSRDIKAGAVFSNLTTTHRAFAEEKIAEVEIALARAKAANVLLIGEAGVGTIDLLLEVDHRLRSGHSIGAVADQRMVLLDTSRLFATHQDKQALEYTLLSLFTEAHNAGNIIIVIENISSFIREAQAMGVFIPELLDPYLASPLLHVVATDTPGAYHTFLEPLGAFSRRFAEVLLDEPDLLSTTRLLQSIAQQNEIRFGLLFTYASLQTITTTADRYLVEGAMPDKAIELLIDIATRAKQAGVAVITPDYVYTVVGERTGVPVGPIGEAERDLLLNLESKLHERVIGQELALQVISRTMRRARAGIQSSEKPIGSFLFLGPTGVGKTETAKALAWIFFGDESKMHRFDMSEFSGDDALARLIGDGTNSGSLCDHLREHPYAVLLLDEFEKGSQAVHDLFIQILDEGIFTDARGERVNARNTIIIATSNAGSQLILQTVKQRQELATLNQEIIDHIVREGVFRAELLNRFDSTVIFEPLKLEEQGQVASLMLGALYERVKERGFELTVNRDLMDFLVETGYSQQFGARAMQRILQDVLEEKIAQLIISGAVTKGGQITLTKADFSKSKLTV